MLILLPLAVCCLTFLLAQGEGLGKPEGDADPRGAFALSVIGWGTLVALFSEGLSAPSLLRTGPMALAWLVALLVLLVVGWRRGSLRSAIVALRTLRPNWSGWERALLAGTGALLLALLSVALIAPPNNVDSLLYHMSRVMHWAQNGTLRHYATGYHHQLIMPPFAELVILNLRLLVGSDRLANLVQWGSLAGSLVIVSAIGRLLGARPIHQILAAVFAATIPMGVLQATSTQNDMVVALWTVCCAYLVFLDRRRPLTVYERVALGLTFGLGLLTKATFVVYGLPLAGLYALGNLRSSRWKRGLASTVMVGALACLLNLPTWARNLGTYGGLYGPSDWALSRLAFSELLPGRSVQAPGPGAGQEPPAAVSLGEALLSSARRISQAAALNLVTPSFAVNQFAWSILDSLPAVFGGVVANSLDNAIWSHEDTAGNPLHLMLLLVAGAAVLLRSRRQPAGKPQLAFAAATAATFLLLPLILWRGSSGYGIRYQLPFFVLGAPLVGLALARIDRPLLTRGLGAMLLVSAVPYVVFNNTRPIVGRPPWPTRVDSVFQAAPVELLFAPNRDALPDYLQVRDWIQDSGCREIGLRLDSGDLEYQIWWLLGAPQSGIRIESVYTYPSLEHLLDRSYRPCAVICTICSGRMGLGELQLRLAPGVLRLYGLPEVTESP